MFDERYNVEIASEDFIDIGSANDRLKFIIGLLEENTAVSRSLVKELSKVAKIYEGYLYEYIDQINWQGVNQNGSKSESL